jgi:hypothetical protein
MSPILAIWIFDQRLQELRAAAERARLVCDARQAGRDGCPQRGSSLPVRMWRRRRSAASPATVLMASRDRVGFAGLADRLATHQPAALERELAPFVEHARRRGASPVLLSILGDPAQPDVARQRAFGRIVAELDNAGCAASPRSPRVADAA